MRLIDADALVEQMESDAEHMDNMTFKLATYAAINDINHQPTIEPQKWIPVSERLPEICEKDVNGVVTFSKQVWACQKYGDGFLWQAIDQYSSFGSWLSEIPIDDPRERCEVVAWMPLPEPWGGDSDD